MLAENVYQKDFAQFLETMLAERDQRYRKFGGSPYIGEPNVKESAGGLRDIHEAMWLASTKFGTRTLRELLDKRLITDREQKTTDEALTFLWRVRNELHFLSGHRNDVLSRDVQPQIAKNFGYAADEISLAVEKFMRDYYLHARVIHRVSRRLIARCRETLAHRGAVQRKLRQEALADGLVVIDEKIHLVHPDGRAFREEPLRLMKVFWHGHRLGLDLGHRRGARDRGLAGPRGRELPALPGGARSPPVHLPELGACRDDVPGDARAGLPRALSPRVGSAHVPGPVRRLPQVHRRSALAARGGAPRGARPGQSAESEGLARVVNDVERSDLLMLGMLLHDIGKGKGHGHVAKGIPLIEALTARLGLPAEDADKVIFLVAHHLTMSHIAQRRDIDDPKTVEALADVCRTPERLRMLYVLTAADMRAVGPGVMTGWQAQILGELYSRTLLRLTGGQIEPPSRDLVAARVWEAMHHEGSRRAVTAHLAMLSDRYLGHDVAPAHRVPPAPGGAARGGRASRPSCSTTRTSTPPSW